MNARKKAPTLNAASRIIAATEKPITAEVERDWPERYELVSGMVTDIDLLCGRPSATRRVLRLDRSSLSFIVDAEAASLAANLAVTTSAEAGGSSALLAFPKLMVTLSDGMPAVREIAAINLDLRSSVTFISGIENTKVINTADVQDAVWFEPGGEKLLSSTVEQATRPNEPPTQ